MASHDNDSRSYRNAAVMAGLQGVLSGLWIAAGELTPGRRRLARFTTVLTIGAAVYAVSPVADEVKQAFAGLADPVPALADPSVTPAEAEISPEVEGLDEAPEFDNRKAALAAGMAALSLAAYLGRRRLEKRWLASLTAKGHPRPTRALALRVGAVDFAAQLALQSAEIRADRAARGRTF
ncbi:MULTISPECIES: hypothetical protein [Actinoplanes]|uniref:hypothetical protein n=1 Tax=Actinoplanes TaxID=1865 RepID=UPI0005F27DFD|nr:MULTISPECIES: hypothetical protein [Actinoplanes]GLY00489.1 hypothetical protein Acsp01_08680 [Actinoplanes sp. NBRC 101535]